MKKEDFSVFSSELLREKYYFATHPSGMKVYVFPKERASFAATLSVPFGSADRQYVDGEGRTREVAAGAAHLLEHRMFYLEDGTDVMNRFSALGADANAGTSYHCTAYYFNGTSRFSECLRTLLHCMTHPRFTTEGLAGECRIVGEEIRMYADCPGDVCYQQLLRALFENDPVREEVCGSETSIAAITPEDLEELWKAFYKPSGMVLSVCGNVTPGQVAKVLDEMLPSEKVPPLPVICPPPAEPERVRCPSAESRCETAHPQFAIGYREEPIRDDSQARMRRDAVESILDDLLFSCSGPFYQDLLERGLLNPSFGYDHTEDARFSFHTLFGESDDPDAVLAALDLYLERVRREGILREDFERCRRVLLAGYIRGFDDPEEIAGALMNAELDGFPVFDYPELLMSVTREEVEERLRTAFRPEKRVLSVVLPHDGETNDNTEEE